MQYFFPFWLLTSDDCRNAAIADHIEESIMQSDELLKSELSCAPQAETLQAAADLSHLADSIFLQLARSRLSISASKLPPIDEARLRDAVRRLLTSVRRRSAEVIHDWTPAHFADLVCGRRWEDDPTLDSGGASEWSGLVLRRVADFHQNAHALCDLCRVRALQKGDPPGDIAAALEAVKKVKGAVADYCRFLQGL